MPRRNPGDGSLSQRKDGRWQASLQIGGRRITVYAPTKAEARQKLDALRQQYRTVTALPERHTLGDLLDLWIDTGAKRWKPRTLANYRLDAKVLLSELGSEVVLTKLTPSRIQAVLNRTASQRRAQQLHQAIHGALALAMRWDWIPANPADKVIRPAARPKERQWWSAEQCRTFLSSTEKSLWWSLWALTLATGCRLGELTALRWSDVDDDHTTLRIDRCGTWVGGQWVETCPKTASGRRTLPLNGLASKALRRQKAQQAAWRLQAGPVWQDHGLIFSTHHGTPLRRFDVAKVLRLAVVKAGLPPATMHTLRHLAASLALQEGVPLPLVSRALGHANVGITAAVYSHAVGNGKAVSAALDRALGTG